MPSNNQRNLQREVAQKHLLGRYSPKGFVGRSEPADVPTGAEEDQPQDGQAKVDPTASPNPPGQAGDEVHSQCDAVNWGEGRGENMGWGTFRTS